MKKILNRTNIHEYIFNMFDGDVHAKRILSISNAVIGVINSASLAIHLIGQGLAVAQGTVTKHAIKQVDRLLSNANFDMESYFYYWVAEMIGSRHEIIIAMDWTDFERDGHTTIALYLVNSHGRATPLIWKTHSKKGLKDNKTRYELEILQRLRGILPEDVHVTILADRGFGYVEFYEALEQLEFDYIVRFKSNIYVTDVNDEQRTAKDWIATNGRAKRLENASITKEFDKIISVIVCVQEKDMKEAWCLAASTVEFKTREIINLYAKRWSIEAKFRDQKNLRFVMGSAPRKV